MIANGNLAKKLSCYGPGGINCHCCGPAPGKVRKRYFRAVKRGRVKAFFQKEIDKQLFD